MSATSMVIERLAGEEDLDAVAALEAATFTNPWTRDMLARELRESAVARVYVLRLPAERVAAFCSCWVILDELHINTIGVAAPHRRHGLATALMRHVIADASADGVIRATLEVRRSNEPAQALYRSLGFTNTGVRKGYYTLPDEDALILTLEWLLPSTRERSPMP
jgi:[ribosomal protein S18]-alanine N-acetyltransferase